MDDHWSRPGTLDPARWARYTATCRRICAGLSTDIRGPYGEGPPSFSQEEIAFNGSVRGRRWARAQRRLGNDLRSHPEDHTDAHEAFELQRSIPLCAPGALYHATIVTAGKPYALSVRCALLALIHICPNCRIEATTGSEAAWLNAHVCLKALTGICSWPPELFARRGTGRALYLREDRPWTTRPPSNGSPPARHALATRTPTSMSRAAAQSTRAR